MNGNNGKAVTATFAELNGPVLSIDIDPYGSFDRQTGTATVSGTLNCSSSGSDQLELEVELSQEQRQGKTTITVKGSQEVSEVSCGSSWTATVTPNNPADAKFDRGAASVTVTVDDASTTRTVWLK